jgi:hypothetical protein
MATSGYPGTFFPFELLRRTQSVGSHPFEVTAVDERRRTGAKVGVSRVGQQLPDDDQDGVGGRSRWRAAFPLGHARGGVPELAVLLASVDGGPEVPVAIASFRGRELSPLGEPEPCLAGAFSGYRLLARSMPHTGLRAAALRCRTAPLRPGWSTWRFHQYRLLPPCSSSSRAMSVKTTEASPRAEPPHEGAGGRSQMRSGQRDGDRRVWCRHAAPAMRLQQLVDQTRAPLGQDHQVRRGDPRGVREHPRIGDVDGGHQDGAGAGERPADPGDEIRPDDDHRPVAGEPATVGDGVGVFEVPARTLLDDAQFGAQQAAGGDGCDRAPCGYPTGGLQCGDGFLADLCGAVWACHRRAACRERADRWASLTRPAASSSRPVAAANARATSSRSVGDSSDRSGPVPVSV